MTLTQFLPTPRPMALDALLDGLAAGPPPLAPFAPETVAFFAAMSDRLFHHPLARAHPDLQALAYWLRPGELTRMRQQFEAQLPPQALAAPRGLVFHVPPANVDTMFVYSWALSALVGNRNVIRLSPRTRSPQVDILLDTLGGLFEEAAFGAIAPLTTMVGYGHDPEINRALSAACDVRVLWGGDSTIEALRAFPLAPHAKELTFPDRFSMAALKAQAFLEAPEDEQQDVARRFFNDAYWFDQLGCASPRIVFWCGPQAACTAAGERFFALLQAELDRRQYPVETGTALKKLLFAHQQILDAPVAELRAWSNGLTVLPLAALADVRAGRCGGGMFFQFQLPAIEALTGFVTRRDQTLTHFGFEAEELTAFARALNGRGLDRLVPIGRALSFQRVWDGFDLLLELSRLVTVEPAPRALVVN